MAMYRLADGSPIVASPEFMEQHYPPGSYTEIIVLTTAAAVTRLARLAFINRFSDGEWTTLDLESIDVPAEGTAARKARARLRRFLLKIASVPSVDTMDPRWQVELGALVTAGLLAANRPAELLAPAASEAEAA